MVSMVRGFIILHGRDGKVDLGNLQASGQNERKSGSVIVRGRRLDLGWSLPSCGS